MVHGAETKRRVLADISAGATVREVCVRYGIRARSTVFLWKREWRLERTGRLAERNRSRLVQENESLRTDLEILLEAGCSARSPIGVRKEAFRRLVGTRPFNRLCRLLGLSRGEGHYMRRRMEARTVYQKEDDRLRPLVKEAFDRSRGTYGKRRVCAVLRKAGHRVSPEHVSRLMREQGLVSKHRTYRWTRLSPRRVYYPNLLRRRFSQSEPNKVWTSDCTYVWAGGRWCFACAIIDLFSRRVVGWGLSGRKTAAFALGVFQDAYRDRGRPRGLTFHSDQGPEFCEAGFEAWAADNGIALSRSAAGTPVDNAVSESFFSSVKKELVRGRGYEDETTLRRELAEYIRFYNEERIHTSLGMRTPDEVERRWLGSGGAFGVCGTPAPSGSAVR